MSAIRSCSRPLCGRPAETTLTYVYADSTMVLGPLATFAEPHCYDLCEVHGRKVVSPVGWELVKLDTRTIAPAPTAQDLERLADAVRQAANAGGGQPLDAGSRRGHLHVVRGGDPA